MQSLPLSNEEIKTIRHALNQVLISFMAIGVIVSILTGAFIIVIYESNAFAEKTNIVFASLLTLIISTFIFFIYRGIKNHILDLQSGTKDVFQTIVEYKNTHTNESIRNNPILDLTSGRAKLVEYFLMTDNHKYFVDQETYELVETGDMIEISLTRHSEIILGIKKN